MFTIVSATSVAGTFAGLADGDTVVHNGRGLRINYTPTAVTLTDVGVSNHAPTITSEGGGDSAALSVDEGTTAVTTVSATDPDPGQTLAYSITGGADAALFTIDGASGALSFTASPNFETPSDAGADHVYNVGS